MLIFLAMSEVCLSNCITSINIDNGPNTFLSAGAKAFNPFINGEIGFNAFANPTSTTNSFNLKRWFNGESISSVNSPGFNIPTAIEFFPENGNSLTNGRALIIPQFLTIAGRNGNSYNIAISGEGTYSEISTGLFEIALELRATNDDLFGGTVTSEYRLYSNNSYTEPDPLTTNNCITETDL